MVHSCFTHINLYIYIYHRYNTQKEIDGLLSSGLYMDIYIYIDVLLYYIMPEKGHKKQCITILLGYCFLIFSGDIMGQ